MAKLELNPNEVILKEGSVSTLQGGKVKFPVSMKFHLTNQRFVYHDLGGWAPFWSSLGLLLKLLIKGKRKEFPLSGVKIERGKYVMNKDLLSLTHPDGEQVLLGGYKYWSKTITEALQPRLTEIGPEEWIVR